ncbi:carboxypeptidase S1 [Stipitochalara longipes BDJ]|nr:carboxypeptidase S1 [Stipitochalara longipes BDJ]
MALQKILLFACLFEIVVSQFPPTPEGITTILSQIQPGVSISYKETEICETTPGVKSFSGYVHLPATLNPAFQPYPNNLFFWFFESRKDPANSPLAIYIQGGPGFGSLISVGSENGPCSVNEDSNSTTLNPWSWNNEVNILYIDQPAQTGFSYDVLTNGTLDQVSANISIVDFSAGTPESNNTILVGTFPSQDANSTANTTAIGAHALWHFAQTWLQEFPAYKPAENKIHLWTESFGGKYAPTFVTYFQEQNEKINNTQGENGTIPIYIGTIGLINGCTDMLSQGAFYPEQAFNNTYGIQAITLDEYEATKLAYYQEPGGCRSLTEICRALATEFDPNNYGNVPLVNEACISADNECGNNVLLPLLSTGRNAFDITQYPTTTFPPPFVAGFANQHWVQDALGVPVNFSVNSNSVSDAFLSTGDYLIARGGTLDQYSRAIGNGVRLAMMYGDRDYMCNWRGGENVSLNIEHPEQDRFKSAGYENIQTNGSYVGGMVRQAGPISFSRVFQAGHLVPAFQPETAYRIFMRTIHDQDVATGSLSLSDGCGNENYTTQGPSSILDVKNELPASLPTQCYLWQLTTTCTANQIEAVENGTAVVKDYLVIEPAS